MKTSPINKSRTGIYMLLFMPYILFNYACQSKHSEIREHINDPGSGYRMEVKTKSYSLNVQYQPPAYRADQEIILNHSNSSRKELIEEYDQLQQFLVQYTINESEQYPSDFGNMDRFTIITEDSIPCIDAHQIQYSPGSPYHEMILLFPVTEKELGKEFTMLVRGFPENYSVHNINYTLN